jgi:hypothetical protein
MSKKCCLCGSQADDAAATCFFCGEATWWHSPVAEPEPEPAPVEEAPKKRGRK